jgi:hypothetical protein
VIHGGSNIGATSMKVFTYLSEIISQEFLFELTRTVNKFHELGVVPGSPLVAAHGLAIIGSESYDPPFIACISIPVPLTTGEASQLHGEWMKLVSKARRLPNLSVTPADVRDQVIDMIINDSHKGEINPDRNMQLGAFWVSHLLEIGLSFDDQVKRNKQHIVTGHFSLVTNDNKCILLNEEVGHRMDGVELS